MRANRNPFSATSSAPIVSENETSARGCARTCAAEFGRTRSSRAFVSAVMSPISALISLRTISPISRPISSSP